MPRSNTGADRRPRTRLDQSAAPEPEATEDTIVFGRQPGEKDEPAKKPAAKSDK